MQRQLQLRIEAQGKYLKKIIEEQQRISGVFTEAPLQTEDPEHDNKTDPATPAPTSEAPFVDKPPNERTSAKSLSLDESFSSHHEPLTPESGCNAASSGKKKRLNDDVELTKPMMDLLTPPILESSMNPLFQQPHPPFLTRGQFGHSSELPIGDKNQLENVSGSNM